MDFPLTLLSYVVVFVVGVIVTLLATRGKIDKEDVERVKHFLMEIPTKDLPAYVKVMLESAILALKVYTGEISQEEADIKLARLKEEADRHGGEVLIP